MKNRRTATLFVLFLVGLCAVGAGAEETALAAGERLFLENKPAEAKPYLEDALKQNPYNEKVYLYLGTIYEQLGDYSQAVSILRRGTEYGREYLDRMYYNIGNNLFKQGNNAIAEEMYGQALEENPQLAEAYLNRANARLKLEQYEAAISDYQQYLGMAPSTPQRENIEQVIDILTGMVEEERARRLAEEQRRKEEEARQKALLNEVLSSLDRASEETKSLSAETDDIQEVEEETDIID